MASQSTGIQQLLAAEKRAAEKVSEARKRKAQRLKQAKYEADAEIQAYRQEREKQFKDHETRILGSKGDAEAKIDQSTKMQIQDINVNVSRNKEMALGQLLNVVYEIKPELHQNLKLTTS